MSATHAVSISPASNDLTLPPCATCQERVDVVVSQEGVASVDVYFLSDTTASMGTILATVQKNVSNILTDLGTAAADVQYGIGAGLGHALALLKDGTVCAWGWNDQGQLGDGGSARRNTPVKVKDLTGVRAIAAGRLHSLACCDSFRYQGTGCCG